MLKRRPPDTSTTWLRFCNAIKRFVANCAFTAFCLTVSYGLWVVYQHKQSDTMAKHAEVQATRNELQADRAQNEKLARYEQFLRTPAGVEHVARERLGLVRPNEVTYIVINKPQDAMTRTGVASPSTR